MNPESRWIPWPTYPKGSFLFFVKLKKGVFNDKIYYYNILEDRKNNTEEYKNIVSKISDYLQYDDEGNKKVFVPAVVAVDKGKIVGFDDETACTSGKGNMTLPTTLKIMKKAF